MKSLVPELRFPEFRGPWKPGRAGDAFRNSKAKGESGLPIYSVTQDRGLVRRDSLDRHMGADAADGSNLRAQPGDLVYNMMRMWQGAVGIATEECMVSPAYVVLSPKKGVSSRFFNYWFENQHMLHQLWAYSHGLTNDRLRLYYQDFVKIPLALPELAEQEKIAAVLNAASRKITLLTEKQTALEDYKRGLMQRLFSRELRFTRDDGSAFPDWGERKLGRCFENRVTKAGASLPVYSVTQDKGMVPRDSLDRDFGGDKTITGYRRAEPGDLVYNTMRMWQGAVGISPVACSVSPAYVVLQPVDGTVSDFFLQWFREPDMVKVLQRYSYGLTEDRLRLYYADFAKVKICVPHPDEQRKIAAALSALDAKIDALSQKITEMEAFKKGLLQKLFI